MLFRSYDHADLTKLSAQQIRHQVLATRRALHAAGVPMSSFVRPPYGAHDARVDRVLAGLGLTTVLWSVDSEDWTGLATPRIVHSVVRQVDARGLGGSVVLQHDGVTNSPATLAAVPQEVHRLRRAGYCFVALDDAGRPAGS